MIEYFQSGGINMIFKNIDFHNVSELARDDDGSYIMHRFPLSVEEKMDGGQKANMITTGVELRFKIRSGSVKIRLKNAGEANTSTSIYQYRGSILDSWQNYVISIPAGQEIEREIRIHDEPELLKQVSDAAGYPYSTDVVRLVLSSSFVRFVDVVGDIEPPSPGDIPSKTYLAYGSSITHGSQAYAMATNFVSQVATYFKVDNLNLGLPGNCRLEAAVADKIAEMGKRGEWNFATLCLGINISSLPAEEFREKVRYMLKTIVSANPEKPVFAISPVYSRDDMIGKTNLSTFRTVIKEEVERLNGKNLHYINGLSLLGGPQGLSGDLVHPSPDGANEIARNLIKAMSPYV